MVTFYSPAIYFFLMLPRRHKNHFEIAESLMPLKVGTNAPPKHVSPFIGPLQQLQLCFLTACA
jgi:hypothetical protein